MVRLTVLLVTAATLLAPGAALAAGPRALPPDVSARRLQRLDVPPRVLPFAPSISSTGAAGSGALIHGTLLDPFGFAVTPSRVAWLAPAGTPRTGSLLTDDTGAYSFGGVPSANGDGELFAVAEPDHGLWVRGRYGMSWADGQDLTVDLHTGKVGVSLHRGGPWYPWKDARLIIWTAPADGNGTAYTMTTVHDGFTTGEGPSVELPVLEGIGEVATVNFWANEGVEVPFTGAVEQGSPTTYSLFAYEDAASRAHFQSVWNSGRPGKGEILMLEGYEPGWVNQIRGRSEYPASAAFKDLTRVTMRESGVNLRVTIPGTAKPGYLYWLAVDHVNGLAALRLEVPYQVCTLKASSTTVARGGTVRLSGVVPVNGRWGARKGTPKTVTLYRGPNSQPQPRTWRPSPSDYSKVADLRTDGYGRFTSRAVRVHGTTTFIVRYPGDATHWRAYTSPVFVRVR